MAAKEIVNSRQLEPVINRWSFDYYFSVALELFKKEEHEDFSAIRKVLDSVLARPIEITDTTLIKIRVLQFLSRISEGENLDLSFEPDQSSPLESALVSLEHINQEISIPQHDFESVCTSLKEMIVVIFIKNREFGKAEEVLNKHFPKPMVGKKAIFMGLIRKKSAKHDVIEQMDFQQFKGEMSAFCQSLCPFSVPFLHKAARMCIDKRESDDKAVEPDGQNKPGPSSNPQINNNVKFALSKRSTISRSSLEAAYKTLAAGLATTFAQMDKEVKMEDQPRSTLSLLKKGTSGELEQDGLFHRESDSPMEASPADQSPQMDTDPQTEPGSLSKAPSVSRKRRLYTVAQLVVEPDGQGSSQCTTAKTIESPQSADIPQTKDPQNPVTPTKVTVPTHRQLRRDRNLCSRASNSLEEDPFDSVANRETCVEQLQSNSSFGRKSWKSRQLSSDSEEDPQESPAPCKTPVQTLHKQLAKETDNTDEVVISNSSLDSSPTLVPHHPVPGTSSTPHKDSTRGNGPSNLKWKQLFDNAKESKDTWSDEEAYFNPRSHDDSTVSNSSLKKKKWSEAETSKLIEGVKKFGEGNWYKIKSYYAFKDRSNVNLKDRWRTMKRLNMV